MAIRSLRSFPNSSSENSSLDGLTARHNELKAIIHRLEIDAKKPDCDLDRIFMILESHDDELAAISHAIMRHNLKDSAIKSINNPLSLTTKSEQMK